MEFSSSTDRVFSQDEFIRYSRHFNLPQVGIEGQKKLKQAKILCIGAGGLGSSLLLYLAAAGVGTIGIADNDNVELSNLHRQLLYTSKEIGISKVAAAKKTLQAINPDTNIITYDVRIDRHNILDIINDYDVIADGTDNFATRYLVNDACFHKNKANIYASIYQFEGQCSIFCLDGGPCYRCLFPIQPPPNLIPNCAEGGVLGVLPGIMGLFQATEAIKYLLGIGSSLRGRLLTFDALAMNFREFSIQPNPNCPLCSFKQPFDTFNYDTSSQCQISDDIPDEISPAELHNLLKNANSNILLIDVREPFEREICHIDGLLVPLKQLPEAIPDLGTSQNIVIYCKAGNRGRKAVKILKEVGFTSVVNLKGGILAWAKEIDTSLTIY